MASSYDDVPYRSLAFPQTHPDHLAAVARIFNLAPPDVGRCRVLELGCAAGGNLLPMAFALPQSEFIGIDLSRRQIDDACRDASALGIANVRFECASLVDITAAWGDFDYIICHGVFSWVEAAVQDRLLQVVGERLTPHGIAYVSYNTYPGWHMRESVREMMRYHAGQFAAPQDKVDQARALLKFLAGATQQAGAYGELLHSEVARLDRSPDSYLFHEHLERANTPIYFHQFVERAGAAGLQFLAEAAISEMLTAHFPADVADTLERISPDLLHLEQYMDFVRNRQFRQTLLCRSGLHPRRALDSSVLSEMLLSSAAVAETADVDLAPGVAVTFADGTRRAQVVSPPTKAAFALLAREWPRAIPFREIGERACDEIARPSGDPRSDDARAALAMDLFGAVLYGVVNAHTRQLPCTNIVAATPRAYPPAAAQASTSDIVVNAHHAMVQLQPFHLELLTLADGQRTVSEIRRQTVSESALRAAALPTSHPDSFGEPVAAGFEQLRRHALLAT